MTHVDKKLQNMKGLVKMNVNIAELLEKTKKDEQKLTITVKKMGFELLNMRSLSNSLEKTDIYVGYCKKETQYVTKYLVLLWNSTNDYIYFTYYTSDSVEADKLFNTK
jgi:hypothetical protein